jgi:hypothetical protein
VYTSGMSKRQIGVEVRATDHYWDDARGCYVFSFECPGCRQSKVITELGIHRCDCGSWLIVTNQS